MSTSSSKKETKLEFKLSSPLLQSLLLNIEIQRAPINPKEKRKITQFLKRRKGYKSTEDQPNGRGHYHKAFKEKQAI